MLARAMFEWLEHDANAGVFTTDTDLRVCSWNQWLVDCTSLDRATVIGRPLFEVLPSLVERGFDTQYQNALAGQTLVLSQAIHRYILPCPDAQGQLMPQRGRIAPLMDGGTIAGTITVVEDVSERLTSDRRLRAQIAAAEQAREQSEAASRAKDEFLATLSHEIRTPLSAVLGWVHLLKTRDPDAVTVRHAVEVIERNAQAQLTLISDMLDMARISTGKVRLEFADVDMKTVVNAALDAVRPAAEAKGVRLVADLRPDAAAVAGDADRLQQIAWNILSNAVKFTGAGGMVVTTLRSDRDGTHLIVADTGQGIDPRFLPQVFERFKQADTSAARRSGGLGLGLALVKDLVTMHGGRVEAESPGTGLGTTFMVHLPTRAAGTAQRRAKVVAPPTGDALQGIGVLIVEDDADAREIASQSILNAGGTAIAVANATEALAALAAGNTRFHAMVSDIGLPGTDGYHLLREVRKLPKERGGSIPAIAVTAYAGSDDARKAISNGFVAHITKPYVPSNLINAVHDAVRPA